MDPSPSVAAIYHHHLEEARTRTRLLSRREFAFSMLRLAVFIAGVALFVAQWSGWPIPPAALLAPIALFILLLFVHQRFQRAIHRSRLREMFYKSGLARLEERWAGTGARGTRYLPEGHPYAADLGLFGQGSLFELLCTAASHAGQERLADWLLHPAAPAEIRERQAAIRELVPRLAEREETFKILRDTPRVLDTETLGRWAAAPLIRFARWELITAAALSALTLTALVALMTRAWNAQPFVLLIIIQAIFAQRLRRRVEQATRFCEQTGHDLVGLVRFMEFIETASFASPRLRHLQECFTGARSQSAIHNPQSAISSASAQVRRLDRIVGLLNDGRHNMAFWAIARLLCWSTHCAAALERWRRLNGPRLLDWVGAVGEFEALASLATFAYENPDHVFPEIAETGGSTLEAEALGHPLIPAAHCVRNDLRLGGPLRLLVVSGSNMSGKSTFLRTLGVNVVLAQAGAPVRARRLRLSPLSLYSLIHKEDSLREGISRFYREIMRVREIIGLAGGAPPLLFLIDEIFDGTNSHDRRVAAEAIVRALTQRGAIGMITSHDLALTEIANQLAPAAANAHFEDQLDGDKLSFDYRLREGAIQRGNALFLMRSIGLEV